MTHPISFLRRIDALVFAVLVVARIRIDTLAEAAVLPLRQIDVARHPFLGRMLPPETMQLLGQQQLVDPIGLLLVVAALGCLLAYLLADEFVRGDKWRYRTKVALIWIAILLTVILPSIKLVLLRQGSGPASYSHDGGVIQTEATIDYLLQGRNPYVEDYVGTPMAEWGINEFRTALYHYPYLPWTFLFSAPVKLVSDGLLGWYDQRFVYLLLFAMMLLLAPALARGRTGALLLLMLLGLNPIMGSDVIFGQNDSFVLAWIVLSVWLWQRGRSRGIALQWASAFVFGLACASKPTAWFLAPFYFLMVAGAGGQQPWREWVGRGLRRTWPAAMAAALVIGPYLVWDAGALYDDVWGWSSGTSETAYQIWGWGASNLVLVMGWVRSRFDFWPFWLPEFLIGAPLLVALLARQWRENSPARAFWGYALFLFAFFFVSRFLNENYLGYLLACFSLGALLNGSSAGNTDAGVGAPASG